MTDSHTPTPVPTPRSADETVFDTVLRGYERRQVDDYVARRNEEVAHLEDELAVTRRRLTRATNALEESEKELEGLRSRSPRGEARAADEGFGIRAEKILRLAEQEAAEARSHATREAAAIIQTARTEAEEHRHEVERSLISRAAILEQHAAAHQAELQDREQQMTDQLVAGREQAEQLHARASRAADQLRQEAEAQAEELRARAAQDVARLRHEAEREVVRLDELRFGLRTELMRLTEVLSSELGRGAAPEGDVEERTPDRAGETSRRGPAKRAGRGGAGGHEVADPAQDDEQAVTTGEPAPGARGPAVRATS